MNSTKNWSNESIISLINHVVPFTTKKAIAFTRKGKIRRKKILLFYQYDFSHDASVPIKLFV